MFHSIKYSFNASLYQATSPFDKSAIISIYTTCQKTCQRTFPRKHVSSGEITINYVGRSSSYTLDEFRKYHSNSEKYTSFQFNITILPNDFMLVFAASPSSIFFNLESHILTVAELEDLRDRLQQELSPIIYTGRRLQPIHTLLEDNLDYIVEKAMTLPVIDKAGNVMSDEAVNSKLSSLYTSQNAVQEEHESRSDVESTSNKKYKRPDWGKRNTIVAILGIIIPVVVTLGIHWGWF